MLFKISRHLKLQFTQTLLVLMAATPFALWANNPPEAEVSVPKGIQDIVQLIKEATVDIESRDKDIASLAQTPPADASNQDKYIFYFLQAQAADRLGRVDLKIDLLKKALSFAREKTHQEFATNFELVNSEYVSGDVNSAINRLNVALTRIPSNMSALTMAASNSLSRLHTRQGDFSNSEKHLRDAGGTLTLSRRFTSHQEFGFIWNMNYFRSVGELAFQKGKFAEAEVAYRKSIEFLEAGLPEYEKKFNSLGVFSAVPGVGANTYSSHPNIFKNVLETLHLALSNILLKMRKVNEAEYHSRESLKMALKRTGRASTTTSDGLRQLGIVLLARERNKDAIYLLNQSIAGLKEAGVTPESIQLALTQKTLASALIADGRYPQALEIYTRLDASIQTYPETARFVDVKTPDRVVALLRTGAQTLAEALARQLLSATELRTGKQSTESTQARLMLATALAEQSKDVESLALFSASVNELVAQERETAADSEGLSSKEKKYLEGYVEAYLGVLARAYEKTPTIELASQAFQLGDLARSSNVQRALSASTARANISNPKLADLVRKEQDLNQQIIFLSRFSKELAMQPASQQLPGIQAKMKADIEDLRKEAKHTAGLIEFSFPEYAELVSPKPVSLSKVQKMLQPNEVLVTWFVGQHSSYVWALPAQGKPEFKSLSIKKVQLREHVAQLRKALDPAVTLIEEIPAFEFARSHQLYMQLLAPVQATLAGKDTLVSVPHDDIGQLPLGVLTTAPFQLSKSPASLSTPKGVLFDNYKSAPWLIQKMAIVSAPSATALAALRALPVPKAGRLDFIAFGDPYFSLEQAQQDEKAPIVVAQADGVNAVNAAAAGTAMAARGAPLKRRNSPNTGQVDSAEVSLLPRLPDTKQEIEEISKVFDVNPSRDLYLNRRATLQSVLKADLANRKVVMFSTHGLVPGELNGLTQPALALTNPEVLNQKGDGLLKVDTVLTLKLNADWVVLSACNTAAGEGEGAEALSGLGRAFFFAGARALLVSSWPVDSEAARKLMTDLFKQYAQQKDLTKPKALQMASMNLLQHGAPDDANSKYSYAHPLFWAPFSMVGN